jgi:hypothetical protein
MSGTTVPASTIASGIAACIAPNAIPWRRTGTDVASKWDAATCDAELATPATANKDAKVIQESTVAISSRTSAVIGAAVTNTVRSPTRSDSHPLGIAAHAADPKKLVKKSPSCRSVIGMSCRTHAEKLPIENAGRTANVEAAVAAAIVAE